MAPLPQKQNGLFKKMLKCYDYKQYKMGLKLAKTILSNPETANHGETLAMKGLILNYLGRKEEAHEFIRKGLRNDLKSHVCWHVYGLLQRSEHKYDDAIKAYRNALKYDDSNITILRDLSLLQIQMRDLEGFRDTRFRLFMLRSAQRISWISFAVAYHLLKDYDTAARILNEFSRTQPQSKQNHDHNKKPNAPAEYEQSELLLYQVMIYQEAGNHKEALDFLTKHASEICDQLSLLEFKADLLLALGRKSQAATLITEQLIARNQENSNYYKLLETASNINQDDESSRLKMYETFQLKYPSSQVPFKVPLSFVQNPSRFKQILDAYMRKCLRKCLPALFRNIKSVYISDFNNLPFKSISNYIEKNDSSNNKENESPNSTSHRSSESCPIDLNYIRQSPALLRKQKEAYFSSHDLPPRIQVIQDLVLSYEKNLLQNSSFDDDPKSKDSETKTLVLWVYYYLAQHYDMLGQYEKALEYIRIAIEHTPTLIELLLLKAKVHKHMGDPEKAGEIIFEVQRLDTADRYLNSKATKYLLRANKITQAEDLCSKFTRVGVPVTENLIEMQCMWFHIETAQAYLRCKQYGKALKKCYEIDAFFSEVAEDQFDFHTYCMRKMTLRSYIRLLRMEDVLRSHRFYFIAAEIAIVIYLHLHDKPLVDRSKDEQSGSGESALSSSELKKIKNKERKAAAKQQQNQKSHGNSKQQNNNTTSGDSDKKNNTALKSNGGTNNLSYDTHAKTARNVEKNVGDPNAINTLDPKALEYPDNALECAVRFLTPLKTLSLNRIETHLLAFEVYKRKGKILLMLQSIERAMKVDANNALLTDQIKTFKEILGEFSQGKKISVPLQQVLALERFKKIIAC